VLHVSANPFSAGNEPTKRETIAGAAPASSDLPEIDPPEYLDLYPDLDPKEKNDPFRNAEDPSVPSVRLNPTVGGSVAGIAG